MRRLFCSVSSCALRQRRAPRFRVCSLSKGMALTGQRRTIRRCINRVPHAGRHAAFAHAPNMSSPLSGQRLAFAAWAVLGVPPAVAACDGYMELEGYAYEWLNPPPGFGSDIVVDAEPPLGRELIPLDGVQGKISKAWIATRFSQQSFGSTTRQIRQRLMARSRSASPSPHSPSTGAVQAKAHRFRTTPLRTVSSFTW